MALTYFSIWLTCCVHREEGVRIYGDVYTRKTCVLDSVCLCLSLSLLALLSFPEKEEPIKVKEYDLFSTALSV